MWLIKESQCLYYKCQSTNPLNIDTSLFAGFFSAFHAFQEELFPSQTINYIDFIEHRLLFVKIDENFFLVVKDSIYKPLNRSILQLNNLSVEILTSIESKAELRIMLYNKKMISLAQLTPLLSPIVEQAIFNLSVSDEQMSRFDILGIIILLRDLREIILEIYDKEIFSQITSKISYKWFLAELLSNQPINIDKFEVTSYNGIYFLINDLFDSLNNSKEFYRNPYRLTDHLLFSNKVLKYLSNNKETMDKFGLTDLFIKKFIAKVVVTS